MNVEMCIELIHETRRNATTYSIEELTATIEFIEKFKPPESNRVSMWLDNLKMAYKLRLDNENKQTVKKVRGCKKSK